MPVKFLIAHMHGSQFVKGDVAKFDAAVEKNLVDRKIAEPHTAKK